MQTIKLSKNANGSISGVIGDKVVTWPVDYSNKPTKRHKTVVVNCCMYKPDWV